VVPLLFALAVYSILKLFGRFSNFFFYFLEKEPLQFVESPASHLFLPKTGYFNIIPQVQGSNREK
jgi:hypothetical protein